MNRGPRPATILKRMRRAVEKSDRVDYPYMEMCAVMPFNEIWECVLFFAAHDISGKRKSTVLRRIDRALEALTR